MLKNDPLEKLARFPLVTALVALAIFLLGGVMGGFSFSSPRNGESFNLVLGFEASRSFVGGVFLVLAATWWVGVLDAGRSAWRAPLVVVAVGTALLPGAALASAAAVALIGWIEYLGPSEPPGDGADG